MYFWSFLLSIWNNVLWIFSHFLSFWGHSVSNFGHFCLLVNVVPTFGSHISFWSLFNYLPPFCNSLPTGVFIVLCLILVILLIILTHYLSPFWLFWPSGIIFHFFVVILHHLIELTATWLAHLVINNQMLTKPWPQHTEILSCIGKVQNKHHYTQIGIKHYVYIGFPFSISL